MKTLREIRRIERQITVLHGEAFQMMLYRAAGEQDLWVWNSRDGVTPFVIRVDGVEYDHAMNAYGPSYTAVLPIHSSHVFADYDRASWEALHRDRYERFARQPDTGHFGGTAFRAQYPTLAGWLAINPFEHGQPRLMTRDEWVAWTASYVGGLPQAWQP